MRHLIVLCALIITVSCASTQPAEEPTQATDAPAAAEGSGGQTLAPEPEAEKQRLAVLDMEDTTGDIDDESLAQATDYLRVLVVQSQRFIVVSDEEKQALIRELRKESHGEQYDKDQQVPLGERVAANVALLSTIMKLQEQYILRAELVDLAQETIIAGASEKFDPDTFQQAIEAIAQAMTDGEEAPAETMIAGNPEEDAIATDDVDMNLTDGSSSTVTTEPDRRPGVNLFIINLVSRRDRSSAYWWHRRAAHQRHEREKHAAAAPAENGSPVRHEEARPANNGNESGPVDTAPTTVRPITFRAPAQPIRFRSPTTARPSVVTLGERPEPRLPTPVRKDEPAPPTYTLPSKKERPAPVFRITPQRNDDPAPTRVEPKKSAPTFFKRPAPVRTEKKSAPATTPRPLFVPKSTTPPKSTAPTKKKKKSDEEDDQKKKKKPSSGTIFAPRIR